MKYAILVIALILSTGCTTSVNRTKVNADLFAGAPGKCKVFMKIDGLKNPFYTECRKRKTDGYVSVKTRRR